jgi:hypothetical protein
MSLAKPVVRSKKSITMDPQIETGARRIQAKLIEKTDKGWSVSVVLNILAAIGLAYSKKLSRDERQKPHTRIQNSVNYPICKNLSICLFRLGTFL